MKTYISIDIGGTAIKYGLISQQGTIIECNEMPTESQLGGTAILEKVLNIVSHYNSRQEVSGVAISTAGMVDPEKGEIIYASELIPRYAGINYKKEIQKRFQLPCEVENDVNCAGLAECISGASKGSTNSLMLTVGTGIGGCLIIHDHIYHGCSYCACEIGRMPVEGKPFEEQASARVMVDKVVTLKNDKFENWDGKRVFDAAKRGDAVCNKAINEMTDALAKGIAIICYMANPEVVVLGGGIMAQGEYIKDRLLDTLSKQLPAIIFKNTRIEFAKQKNNAGMMGAFYNYIQRQQAIE